MKNFKNPKRVRGFSLLEVLVAVVILTVGLLALASLQLNMSDRFELVAPFSPTGDQPQAIEKLSAGFEAGVAQQVLLGVTGSGKTYTIANLIERVQKPTLVLAPNKTLAAQLYGEFRSFFPHNAVEYFVSYYDYFQPEAYVVASDTFIEKDSSINEHIEQMRLSATKALLERRDAIIVATVSSIYGLGDPNEYFRMVLHMGAATPDDLDELARIEPGAQECAKGT